MAMSTTPNELPSQWHAGELAMQAQVGVVERMDEIGRRVVRNYLIAQHRQFYAQLPFVVLGSVDGAGDAWATVRAGAPGFLHSSDPSTLRVDLPRDAADPADAGMDDGRAIGLLGIELHTRRRNRLNGTIRRDANGFDVVARQSYGNCPKYIRLRDFRFTRDPSALTEVPAIRLTALDDDARRMIAGADTFFVASSTERDGVRDVDVSHRGGKPGFVRVDGQGVLTIPDFAGNNFFNTLGNIVSNPRAGIVFVDFATGDLLQLTGDAEVVVDSSEIAAFQGAERLWRFRPRVVVRRPDALAVRWIDEAGGESPNSLMTGDWNDAGTRLPVRGA
jgi:predicted pyridoxine 5'-phosphate oxidase superfamily flavin-nucleotide-binding protein